MNNQWDLFSIFFSVFVVVAIYDPVHLLFRPVLNICDGTFYKNS